jgi:hypothetical protein
MWQKWALLGALFFAPAIYYLIDKLIKRAKEKKSDQEQIKAAEIKLTAYEKSEKKAAEKLKHKWRLIHFDTWRGANYYTLICQHCRKKKRQYINNERDFENYRGIKK